MHAVDDVLSAMNLDFDESHDDCSGFVVERLCQFPYVLVLRLISVLALKRPDALRSVLEVFGSDLPKKVTPVLPLLSTVAFRTCGDDVSPCLKTQVLPVQRNQVVLVRAGRFQVDPAEATAVVEELTDGLEVGRLAIRGEASHFVVVSANTLQENPHREVGDVCLALCHTDPSQQARWLSVQQPTGQSAWSSAKSCSAWNWTVILRPSRV
jgi:hypothetical protein